MTPFWGSGADSQSARDAQLEGAFGDSDGWVRWTDHRPEPDIPVECRREGEDEIHEVTPRTQSMEWNIAGVFWRTVRGGK